MCNLYSILAAAFGTWRSPAYRHYNIYLNRVLDTYGNPHHLSFRFECKHNRPSHLPQFRDRLKTGNGTQNLLSSAKTCDSRWGVTQPPTSSPHFFSGYSEARHRVLIALRCAQNKRAFNSVADKLYQQEVELLRPGTMLPSPKTVSRDIQTIYASAAGGVREYLQVCSNIILYCRAALFSNQYLSQNVSGALHLAIDGWTSPQASSFLGVVVIWRDQERIWRSILEFIQYVYSMFEPYKTVILTYSLA